MRSKKSSEGHNVSRSLAHISQSGVSIWLDDLSRERLNGQLAEMIERMHVVGVTTNPAIFSAAISGSDLYREDIMELAREGYDEFDIVRRLTTDDVKAACDILKSTFQISQGKDGRVSIEVDPELARDTAQTVSQGLSLWDEIAKENLLIKVPATREGLGAITELTDRGISVNVTLIFTPQRYEEVIDAYFTGLERRVARGAALDSIHSVASFFVSRIDTEIDKRLSLTVDDHSYRRLRGRAGVANALNAYSTFLASIRSERWLALLERGANLQRPLWASTGVKDPQYSPTLYVDRLLTPNSVNTMPENTLVASSRIENLPQALHENSIEFEQSRSHMEELATLGIAIDEVGELLEEEGLSKFVTPWVGLHNQVRELISL